MEIVKIDKSSKSAIFITLMLSCNSISLLLSFIPGISAIIVVTSFIAFLFVRGQLLGTGNLKNLFFFLFIISLGFVRQLLAGNWCPAVQDCLFSFIIFGIPFLFVNFYNLDYKKIVLFLMLVGVVLTPVNIRNCMYEYLIFASDDGQMKASYNILFYIIPSIIVVFGHYNNIMKLLALIEAFVGCVFLISFGSKGAIFSVVVGGVLILLYRENKQIKIISSKIITIVLIGTLILYNFEVILLYVSDLLEKYGIVSSAIPELLYKIASEDNDQLTSGRTLIYKSALNQIYDSPIFGYGIAAFNDYSGAYPHNLIIQLLYEGGIVVLIPYILLLLLFIKKMNAKSQYVEIRFFCVFLLSAGLIRLVFSHNFWESQLFWFSIGIVLKDFAYRRTCLPIEKRL